MVSKTRIIVSVLVIAIIGILVVPMESDNSEPITNVYESDFVSSDDINMDKVIIDQAIQEYSIIETNRVFTESDQSLVEQFLDESGLPSSSEKLGIEVQTVLFDSDQKQYPSSNIIGIPELSVTDEQGRLLDLGTIQTSFLAISAKTEQQFNLEGTVKFYLDDDLITTKRIYGSDSNKQNHELSIIDSLPPTSFDRPKAFTFTLSDEGRDWEDKSEHTYRVVLTEVNANLDSNKDFKQFSWTGENIVYELKVKVDEQKKVIQGCKLFDSNLINAGLLSCSADDYNSAIQIFKNDSTFQICGASTIQEIPYRGYVTYKTDTPSVVIKQSYQTFPTSTDYVLPILVDDISFNPSEAKADKKKSRHDFGNVYTKSSCSEKVSGIPRDTNIVIEVTTNGIKESFGVHTPKSQFNFHINAELAGEIKSKCYYSKQGRSCDNPNPSTNAVSNFGHGNESNGKNIESVLIGSNMPK